MSPKLALAAMWDAGLMMWTVRLTQKELEATKESIPETYNEFCRKTFLKWVKEKAADILHVEFGREFSPVAYIYPLGESFAGFKDGKKILKADEFDVVEFKGRKALRIWWD